MTAATLPDGWGVELDPEARRRDGGRTLIGGHPLRVLTFTDAGARWIDALERPGGAEPETASQRELADRLVAAGLAHPQPTSAGPYDAGDVTVVIPVRDDPDGLESTLARIGGVGAVVVVDDASSQPVVVEGAVVLRNDRSRGPGGARQRGAELAGTPVVAFVDAGVHVADGWLEPLLALLADPAVVAVAPRVRSRAGAAPGWLARYEAARSPLDLGSTRGVVQPGGRPAYVPTAALIVRRDAFLEAGGFDPALEVGEDVDLVWRLHERGATVRYEPSVVVDHPARPGLGPWLRQRFRYGTSAAPLARRHGDAVAPLGISGWSAMAWTAAIAGHPLVGAGIGVATTAALVPKLERLEHPVSVAVELAGKGTLWAGRSMADALRRPWWPAALALGVTCRRARPALIAAAVVPPLIERRERRPDLGVVPWTALCLLDDVAYGTGVWMGCARERSARAMLPRLTGRLARPSPA